MRPPYPPTHSRQPFTHRFVHLRFRFDIFLDLVFIQKIFDHRKLLEDHQGLHLGVLALTNLKILNN